MSSPQNDRQPESPKPAEAAPEAAPAVQTPKPLSAEEQMARFEDELKETDWGHQPC